MASEIKELVPDIGDFSGVEVIEVLVSEGDHIQVEDSLVTLESDKATMEIPAAHAGVVKSVKVKVGDTISEGDLLLTLEAAESGESDQEKRTAKDDQAERVDAEDKQAKKSGGEDALRGSRCPPQSTP